MTKRFVYTTAKVEEYRQKIKGDYTPARYENPFRTDDSDVRRANVPFIMTNDEKLEYARCKFNITYFARKYCQIKLPNGEIGQLSFKGREYQKDILNLINDHRFTILMASRQIGKCQNLLSTVTIKMLDEEVDMPMYEFYNQINPNKTIFWRFKYLIYKTLSFLVK